LEGWNSTVELHPLVLNAYPEMDADARLLWVKQSRKEFFTKIAWNALAKISHAFMQLA
jgi:hypothetical protein